MSEGRNVHYFPGTRGLLTGGSNLGGEGGPPYVPAIEPRVAVLEQITKQTHEALIDLRAECRSVRTDLTAELRAMRSETRTEFRWLLGLMLSGMGALLAVMAHGFHWL